MITETLGRLERAHKMGCSDPDDPTKHTLYGDGADAIRELAGMLREATEVEFTEPCRFDHHGDCQAHGYFDGPCLIPRAKAVLEAIPERT